jgi:hypothetical protein
MLDKLLAAAYVSEPNTSSAIRNKQLQGGHGADRRWDDAGLPGVSQRGQGGGAGEHDGAHVGHEQQPGRGEV